jgi:hypothetical protein
MTSPWNHRGHGKSVTVDKLWSWKERGISVESLWLWKSNGNLADVTVDNRQHWDKVAAKGVGEKMYEQ